MESDILCVVEKTTRNARRMKFWQATFGNGCVAQICRDAFGRYFVDGVEIKDGADVKQIQEAIQCREVAKYK